MAIRSGAFVRAFIGRSAALAGALAAATACGWGASAAFAAASAGGAHWTILDSVRLGGAGGWDYLSLDAAGKRLFISRGDHVDVLDTASRQVIGSIPNTAGVHGIALDEAGHRGFTSNGRADTVTVVDLDTLKPTAEWKVSGHNPDAIVYEPAHRHVFTFNGRSKDVSVLDAGSGAVVATFAVPDKPEFAADDGAGHIYLNIESEQGQMVVIDTAKLAVSATWSLPGCSSPSGLALDKANRRLFSVCDGGVMAVTDADTGRQVARVKIGEGPDAAAYDPQRHLVFSSNGAGTLTIVRQESKDKYQVLDTLKTRRGARTMALDPASGRVYLVTADFGPPPAPTVEQPHPRPTILADSFTLLVAGAH